MDSSGDFHGADLVIDAADDADLDRVRRHAPASVVLVAGQGIEARCRDVYNTTFFPRARIIGVRELDDIEAVAESIVFERGDEHEVVAMADDEFRPCRARLGRGGIRELL